jgi:hypothetical protein
MCTLYVYSLLIIFIFFIPMELFLSFPYQLHPRCLRKV